MPSFFLYKMYGHIFVDNLARKRCKLCFLNIFISYKVFLLVTNDCFMGIKVVITKAKACAIPFTFKRKSIRPKLVLPVFGKELVKPNNSMILRHE